MLPFALSNRLILTGIKEIQAGSTGIIHAEKIDVVLRTF